MWRQNVDNANSAIPFNLPPHPLRVAKKTFIYRDSLLKIVLVVTVTGVRGAGIPNIFYATCWSWVLFQNLSHPNTWVAFTWCTILEVVSAKEKNSSNNKPHETKHLQSFEVKLPETNIVWKEIHLPTIQVLLLLVSGRIPYKTKVPSTSSDLHFSSGSLKSQSGRL